jgi:hypothetical protein
MCEYLRDGEECGFECTMHNAEEIRSQIAKERYDAHNDKMYKDWAEIEASMYENL